MHGSSAFGPVISVDIVVSGANSPASPDLRVVSGPSIVPTSLSVGQQAKASFVVRNYGSSSASVAALGLGGRGPLGVADVEDFPLAYGIVLPPGTDYSYTSERTFNRDGLYTFFPVFQTWEGQWIEMASSDGSPLVQYLSVHQSTAPALKSIETHYDANSREVVDVTYRNLRENPDGSITADIVIKNKKWVALAARFYDFGTPVGGDSQGILDREYVVIMPTNDLDDGYNINDVVFWPDSELHVLFTAWGTGSGGPENIHDTGVVMTMNVTTMLCAFKLHDKCPSNVLSLRSAALDEILNILAEDSSVVGWFQLLNGYGDPIDMLEAVVNIFKASPQVVVKILGVLGVSGITEEAVKQFLGGAPIDLILGYRSLIYFAWDFGGTRWWGVSEVSMVPSTRPAPTVLRIEPERTSDVGLSPGSALPVQGSSVVASSSEFGHGWEFYALIDGDYGTGWGNGGRSATVDEWVTIRLANGRAVTVDQVRVHPGPTGSDTSELALKEFRVESSLDGVHFEPLLSGNFGITEVGVPKTFSVQSTLANYLRFHALSNHSGGQNRLLSVAELEVFGQVGLAGDPFEPDSDVTLAKWLPAYGRQAVHTFSYAGDTDWIQFRAKAGVPYVVETGNLGPGADTVLELYDQDSASLLALDDNSGPGLASRIEWTAPREGTYFVLTRHRDPNVGGEGTSYEISVWRSDREQSIYLPLLTSNYRSLATLTIYGDQADGELGNLLCDEWVTCRDASWGNYLVTGYAGGTVSAGYNGSQYDVRRIFLFFDTSSLPPDAVVEEATLTLHAGPYQNGSSLLHVVRSTVVGALSHDDYDDVLFQSGGAAFFPADAWVKIHLNATALGWISKAGLTELALVHDKDLGNSVPNEYNDVLVSLAEDPEYRPYLSLTYYVP